MRIVFLDRETLAPTVTVRRPPFVHDWIEYGRTAPEEVAERAARAEIVIVNKVPMRRDTIAALPHLKLIAVAATGTDIIDLDACREHGVVVSNIRGYAVHAVPEHTFALMLALRRNLFGYREAVRRGRWQEAGQFCFFDYPIADLYGARLGIVGEGAIGQAVADIGRAFGMTPLFAAHRGRPGMGPLYTPWEEVLATSDVITLHCPLTPETRGLLGVPEFAAMARRPLLINTARGGLIDEAALIAALDSGQIAGAAIDVLPQEPPPADHGQMRVMGRFGYESVEPQPASNTSSAKRATSPPGHQAKKWMDPHRRIEARVGVKRLGTSP